MERLSERLKDVLDNCIDSISQAQQEVIDEAVALIESVEEIKMPDYIERRKAAEIVCDIVCGKDKGLCVSTPDKCQQGHMIRLYEIPAADVDQVVRCRECVHYTDWGACGNPDNGWDAPQMGPEDFCSRGERKADGN